MNYSHRVEYKLIHDFYGNRTAKRSGVRLMNHIDEGLYILDKIRATDAARMAFCLHPLVQADDDLVDHIKNVVDKADPYVLSLALEYRNIANQYLSWRTIGDTSEIKLSPLGEVNDMLVADKIQNYKDFLIYHKDTHLRSKELDEYFNNWLYRLAVDKNEFDQLYMELIYECQS